MKISKSGLQFLKDIEGFKLKPYKDSKGLLTIGVGHLITPWETFTILTELEVEQLLKKDLEEREDVLNKFMEQYDLNLTQFEFDSLVSFIFNVGEAAFLKSTMAKKLAQRFNDEAALEFDRWMKPKEIISRRIAEKNIFLTEEMFDEIIVDKRMTQKQINIMVDYVTRYRTNANKEGLFKL